MNPEHWFECSGCGHEAEVKAVLDNLPCAIRVHEEGGSENVFASLAVSAARLARDYAEAKAEIARLKSLQDSPCDRCTETMSENETLRAELSDWQTGAHADATGHLYRCARVNGVWQCDKACQMSAVLNENARLKAQLAEARHERDVAGKQVDAIHKDFKRIIGERDTLHKWWWNRDTR